MIDGVGAGSPILEPAQEGADDVLVGDLFWNLRRASLLVSFPTLLIDFEGGLAGPLHPRSRQARQAIHLQNHSASG